uniref:Sushi domain-containing protein n=1 Tax=Strigamia maritima TaxID=126957 RepID=T1J8N7_STRMM
MNCIFCLVITTLSGLSYGLVCRDPSKPSHSTYSFNGSATPGTVVQYFCLDGYKLIGKMTQRCNEDGTWLPYPPPTCVPDSELTCGFPGHGPHTKVDLIGFTFLTGSIATYTCDEGYFLIGPVQRSCQVDGKWSSTVPFCAVNVSKHRIVTAVSQFIDVHENLSQKGSGILDYNNNTRCSIAEQTDKFTSYWKIDLLELQNVDVITLIFVDQTDVDIILHVGKENSNKTTLPLNTFTISKWSGRVKTRGILTSYEFSSKRSLKFQYLTVEAMPTPNHSTLQLCELLVLSKSASSSGQCYSELLGSSYIFDISTVILKNICYSFAHSLALSWTAADAKCKELTKGGLVADVDITVQRVLSNILNDASIKQPIQSHFWIGGKTTVTKGNKNVHWIWKNGAELEKFYWGKLQPDMSATELACLSLSRELDWQWDDKTCESSFVFVCQHNILRCGTPDVPENTLIEDYARLYTDIGATVTYICPPGNSLQGDLQRHCLDTGHWSGSAPSCLPDESNDDCDIVIKYST